MMAEIAAGSISSKASRVLVPALFTRMSATKGHDRAFDERAQVLHTGHVRGNREPADGLRQRRELVGGASGERHLRAPRGEEPGRRFADSR
jgi:hypothetical protein